MACDVSKLLVEEWAISYLKDINFDKLQQTNETMK